MQCLMVIVLLFVNHKSWQGWTPSPMIMCKAEVTGSFTPTVAKQTQSVEPVGSTKYSIQEPLDTTSIVIIRVSKCFICTTLPAGMMPMWRWQGRSVTLRSFSERPASCWVRPIMPCIISLNIPSPPTHTTLLWTNTKASVMKPSPIELSCCNPLVARWLHGHVSLTQSSSPVEAWQVFLQKVVPRLVSPLSH